MILAIMNLSFEIISNKLNITVKEYPIIQSIFYNGIEAKKFVKIIEDNSRLKAKSPFNDYKLKQDINLIKNAFKQNGFSLTQLLSKKMIITLLI